MFTKIVSVPRKNKTAVQYLQIVESVRAPAGGGPRHRVLLNLGRADQLDPERVKQLIRVLSAHLEQGSQEPPPAETQLGQTRELGLPWLAGALWSALGLERFWKEQLRRRRLQAPLERALLAMTAHRLQDPKSKRKDFIWLRGEAFFPWAGQVELHHFYRALDFLQENRDALEQALFDHRRGLFNQTAEFVYFDTTTVHFEMDEDPEEPDLEGLRQYGRPKDGRSSHRLIVIAMAVDPDGLPLFSQTFPGNTVDASTLAPALARLKALGVQKTIFVADRGAVSQDNLLAVRAAGLDYIVGLRLRRAGEDIAALLDDPAPYEEVEENLLAKTVEFGGRRLTLCFSPLTAEREAKSRGRSIERLNDKLKAARKARDRAKAEAEILAHGLHRRWVERDSRGGLVLSRRLVARESRYDGVFVLETSDPDLTTAQTALGYKRLLRVERAWQTIKHGLDVQPVFLRTDERIEAHVTLCMIAYLLERWTELRTGRSFDEIRQWLRPLHATELICQGQHLWKTRDPLPKGIETFLKKLGAPAPPRVLHIGELPAPLAGEIEEIPEKM